MLFSELSARTVSSFPLSIGTGLAFESLFESQFDPYDPNREIPNRINIANYNALYINLETLVRNIMGSVKKEVFLLISPKEIASTLISEIEVIDSLLMNEGNNVCKAVYYYSDYSKIKSTTNVQIKIRKPVTDLQEITNNKTQDSIKVFLRDNKTYDIKQFHDFPTSVGYVDALILTHIPYDLLGNMSFNRLDLLESHTGKLKDKKLWYTKFNKLGDHDLSYIPFHKRFLVCFGDHVMFHPWAYSARVSVLDIAKIGHWTFATTEAKIKQDLEIYMKDYFLRDNLLLIK